MTSYQGSLAQLRESPRSWLVTGVAGFIGSNLLEQLLLHGQTVVGLDNFSTGYPRNLEDVRRVVGDIAWRRFRFIEGDIRDPLTCRRACGGVDFVLHQAALGSVPRSVKDPLAAHATNVTGFLNVLIAARDEKVQNFVYAASSATYGDHPALPKVEHEIGNPLSPYAVTKRVNELYAYVFAQQYRFRTIGLRYFNVFGRRQDPTGAYAAVIPLWVSSLLEGRPCAILGDGETSRDFCFIDNVVQANILAATSTDQAISGEVFNIAVGDRTSLNELFAIIRDGLAVHEPRVATAVPLYGDFRPGDVRHSQADIRKARVQLGYQPTHSAAAGLREALAWYVADHGQRSSPRAVPISTAAR